MNPSRKWSLACAMPRSAGVCAALALSALAASAQTRGNWIVQGGVGYIDARSSSGDLSPPAAPGVQFSLGRGVALMGAVTYAITNNWSVQLLVNSPISLDVDGAGTASGSGQLASVKAVVPALLLQYRFLRPRTDVRPYVGLGVAHANFSGAEGSGALTAITGVAGTPTQIAFGGGTGPIAQVGLTYNPYGHWHIDAGLTMSFVKSNVTLSTGQTLDLKLSPLTTMLTAGYRF